MGRVADRGETLAVRKGLEACVDEQEDFFGNAGLDWKPMDVGRFQFVWMRTRQAEFWTYCRTSIPLLETGFLCQ